MVRLILIFFVFLVLGTGLTLVFRDDSGYVMVAYAGYQLETSLLFAAAVLLVAIWVLITLWRIVVAGVLLPRTTRRWYRRRRSDKARRSLYTGLLSYAEGRWAQAESEIKRLAERHEAPGINYLLAAHAAQWQTHSSDRDRYLEQAASKKGVSELAVMLAQARLQMKQGQDAEALASLERLRDIESQHPLVLELYAEQCVRMRDYAKLRQILPELYKYGTLAGERMNEMAVMAWENTFEQAGNDAEALKKAWNNVPKWLRRKSNVVAAYARHLHQVGADEQAAKLIRDVLKREWHPTLVLLFGDVKTSDEGGQLANVEHWLKQYGEEPELLLVAGRLCLRNRLWGRARSYLEASLRNQPDPEALLELGRLFEEIEQPDNARAAYRRGLEYHTQ